MHRLFRIVSTALIAAAALLAGACGSGDGSSGVPYQPPPLSERTTGAAHSPVRPKARSVPVDPPDRRDDAAEPAPNGAVRVHGRVSYAGSGRPYAGAWVQFRTVAGESVHTTSDGNGNYSLPVPPDVYTAFAGDQPDADLDFSVANRPGNAVSIPPDTTVDFVVTPTG